MGRKEIIAKWEWSMYELCYYFGGRVLACQKIKTRCGSTLSGESVSDSSYERYVKKKVTQRWVGERGCTFCTYLSGLCDDDLIWFHSNGAFVEALDDTNDTGSVSMFPPAPKTQTVREDIGRVSAASHCTRYVCAGVSHFVFECTL